MSLLLDALKRAEQEKLARQGEASNDSAPVQAAAAPPAAAKAPALELQPIGGAAPGLSAAARNEEAARAQALFNAKTPAADEKRSRGMLLATLGAIAVVLGSAGAYVWYQLHLLSPAPTPAVVRRPPPFPLPLASTGAPPPLAPIEAPAPSAATVTVAAEPATRPAPGLPPQPQPPGKSPAPDDDPVLRMLREAPAVAAEPPLKLARSLDRPAIAPDVAAGYAALRGGDLAEARRRYEAAIAGDDRNLDARLGIATVEARAGNRTVALTQYRRVLDMDPRNATALAGIAALLQAQAPEAVEAQLREDVARFPQSAALRFALGAHYASQRRWGEAQAAFFEAHRLDPAGADILYNLAVSLDHIKQTRLALEYYRRAAEAAQSQPTQFDPAPVRRRIAELAAR